MTAHNINIHVCVCTSRCWYTCVWLRKHVCDAPKGARGKRRGVCMHVFQSGCVQIFVFINLVMCVAGVAVDGGRRRILDFRP